MLFVTFFFPIMLLCPLIIQVRAVSARALGAMVRGMGESSFEDLLPWLMTTLTSETSSVDRYSRGDDDNGALGYLDDLILA